MWCRIMQDWTGWYTVAGRSCEGNLPKRPNIHHLACAVEGNMRNNKTINSIFPKSALMDIRTPKRPNIHHLACAVEGNMRNNKTINSIFPKSALMDIRTPKRPNIHHLACAVEGNMRNYK